MEKPRIDYSIVSEFSKILEKSKIEDPFVYFFWNAELSCFSMVAGNDNKFVSYEGDYQFEDCPSFSAGIDVKTFLSVAKLFKKGFVEFFVEGNNLVIGNNNSEAKFPIHARVFRFSIPEGSIVEGETKDWIVQSLADAYNSIADVTKKVVIKGFPGILLDVTNKSSRICKFSETSLYINSCKPICTKTCTIIFPDVFAVLCKALQKSISKIVFCKGFLGIAFKNGCKFVHSFAENKYPKEYSKYLGVRDSEDLVLEEDLAEFDKKDLISVVKLISASLGDDEFWIQFNKIDETKWEVSGRSYNGFEIKETINCTGNLEIDSFGVNKKKLLKGLSVFEEKVYFKNMRNSIGLFNKERTKAVFLTKAD